MTLERSLTVLTALALVMALGTTASGQVGKGIEDLNTMPEGALAALPGMNAAIAKAVVGTRPFGSLLSIPGAGARMVREFKEYRPWKTKEQFEKEIGKYVNATEVTRLWRYVVIQ